MKTSVPDNFEDTEIAFHYKSNIAVRKAYMIFSILNHPWISAMGTGVVTFALKLRLPVESIIRRTVFDLFCGGESVEETKEAVERLGKHQVHTILDYSVEGEDSERGFDHVMNETLRTIEKALTSPFIPFSVFKVTGLGQASLLEKVQLKAQLTGDEMQAYQRVRGRVETICNKAHNLKIPVLIDAEESWIQDPIDQLADEMMARFNLDQTIVFNTYQLYRSAGLQNLKDAYQLARKGNYTLGAKVVRGAYMEKERERAMAKAYPSPIHPDKDATDNAFNDALKFCISHLEKIAVMCGSHNEYSNRFLASLMNDVGLRTSDQRIWFAQLYGMSDNISFNLANQGYNVAKYLPYGPVRAVMPYLLRRAAENTSVAGQSSRELVLIKKELKRRQGKSGKSSGKQ